MLSAVLDKSLQLDRISWNVGWLRLDGYESTPDISSVTNLTIEGMQLAYWVYCGDGILYTKPDAMLKPFVYRWTPTTAFTLCGISLVLDKNDLAQAIGYIYNRGSMRFDDVFILRSLYPVAACVEVTREAKNIIITSSNERSNYDESDCCFDNDYSRQ